MNDRLTPSTHTRVAARRTDAPGRGIDAGRRKFSLGASFLGWCVASFLTLVGLAIVAGILGGAAAAEGDIAGFDVTGLGLGAVVGGLVAMFLAYLIGGYAAGRIARWRGAMHGATVPLWSILAGILGAIIGTTLGARYAYLNPFGNIDFGALAGAGILSLILGLIVMFGGAMLGGTLGERGEERYLEPTSRRATTRIGRRTH